MGKPRTKREYLRQSIADGNEAANICGQIVFVAIITLGHSVASGGRADATDILAAYIGVLLFRVARSIWAARQARNMTALAELYAQRRNRV